MEEEKGQDNGNERSALDLSSALPEGCIANILSLTSPKDACRLSLLCSTFLSAAKSDAVWHRFLPSDYASIVSRSTSSSSSSLITATVSSKRDLYFRLCDSPILIDEGKKSFSLERQSGKKCYMLAPRDLHIVWSDTPRYWIWTSLPESRFPEVAELVHVCWLEIRGKIKTRMLSPNTNYAAYFVFKWNEQAFGFRSHPLELSVGVTGSESNVRSVDFKPESANRSQYQFGRLLGLRARVSASTGNACCNKRADGWCEIEMGEFFNEGDEDGEVLEMSVKEVVGGDWKSGIVVEGIEIRPKEP